MKAQLCIGLILLSGMTATNAAVTYTGGTYSENFDSLGAGPWVNNSTLHGWYAYRSTGIEVQPGRADDEWSTVGSSYSQNNGQGGGGLHSLGTSALSPARSLGSKSPASWDVAFAMILYNDTSTTFTDFTLSYYGEQWQVNTILGSPSMKLDFTFGVFSSLNASATNANSVIPHNINDPDPFSRFNVGFTDPTGNALDVYATQFDSTSMPLDGTAAQNRQLLSGTESVTWAPGQYLVLRWFDDYSGGTQALLGINDLQFQAFAVPEPSRIVLAGFGFAFACVARRRRSSL